MKTTERQENGVVIREHLIDGEVVGREVFPIPTETESQTTQLDEIQSTLDILLLKQEGIL